MTREEAEEKYGEVPLFFQSYYKYSFTFVGKAPDGNIVTGVVGGGDAYDIYRSHVGRDTPETIESCRWFEIKAPDGTSIATFDDDNL